MTKIKNVCHLRNLNMSA